MKAFRKLRTYSVSKAWLALIINLNNAKDEKTYAERVRQNVKEKNHVGKPLEVNPILDKILPDEKYLLMKYHADQVQGDDDFKRGSGYIYENSSIISGLREDEGANVNGNPFKTL